MRFAALSEMCMAVMYFTLRYLLIFVEVDLLLACIILV